VVRARAGRAGRAERAEMARAERAKVESAEKAKVESAEGNGGRMQTAHFAIQFITLVVERRLQQQWPTCFQHTGLISEQGRSHK
jgi:hypothetical protein